VRGEVRRSAQRFFGGVNFSIFFRIALGIDFCL
jgi:hypothetical protein